MTTDHIKKIHAFVICPVIQCLQFFIFYDDNVTFREKSMILCHDHGTEKGLILGNMLIYVAKWTI